MQNLETLALIEAKKFVTENLPGEKEKWTNKGIISSSMLILFYTIQQVIPNIYIHVIFSWTQRDLGLQIGRLCLK